ncbi:hypothetical protein DAETH_09730 [Deinococcus aetherius]|uniref:Lipoprotein n=1 Tax=Deinococcus aetherius TaxID=200252 RepID=A0ABN6RED2_9DEIO|nr:hypothetical protein [Deinococcus aetherius]BDP41004.1 hypothetical protein DAETH_09730 [Deinococcus aetherius]
MKKLLPLLVLASAVSCAPLPTQTVAPTRVTTTVGYVTGTIPAGADNPVLAAVVSTAPTAPTTSGRQPWRAEEIERNQVVLRSNATSQNTSTFGSFIQTLPQEMTWGVISSGNTTTVTATYSSAYAATAQYIFDQLDKRFRRVR